MGVSVASFEDGQGSDEESWNWFIKFTSQHLRPSNSIELLLLSEWNRSWPPNQPYYLQQLGHSVLQRLSGFGLSPDIYHSVADFEADAVQRATDIARGKVFMWEEQEAWIIRHIMAVELQSKP
ncbi:hypothetical protein CIRG_10333 [Coccidioides immitis RMSCC 2394]|uniref:Uncharacterized protein n=1 Tax=Coccidioides immitis RMSCC 2394 TaxID=404692 RepID=A0A0J6Y476_COCIT|nr:hypothetical protein CIRG_10333 [Coccidioides immitis RMSCC 2394]